MHKLTRRFTTSLAVATVAVALLACTSSGPAAGSHRTAPGNTSRHVAVSDNWTTYHYTQTRQGYDPNIPTASGHLSTAWATKLDGAVYGEPLFLYGRIIAVTENDTVYAISLAGKILWKHHLGTPVPLSELPCGNIDPLGITGTPIYDPTTEQVYLVAELDNPIRHTLYAIHPATGNINWSRSADPRGLVASATQERGALAIAQGRVWVPFGGLAGDCGPYHGWVVGSLLSGQGALSTYQQPSSREAGIWAPSGPAVDSTGHLFVAVGNGAATAPPYDDSDSILRLDGNKKIGLFAPSNWAHENAVDLDLGSTGPILFNAMGQFWAYADGKAGDGYLLHQQQLGGIGGFAATVADCKSFGGMAFHSRVIYVPCVTGLSAYEVRAGPTLHKLWQNSDAEYGAAPVLGGGAVWAVYNGRLVQINPADGTTVTSIDVGTAPHFATPTLHGSLVLVGTLTGLTAVRTS